MYEFLKFHRKTQAYESLFNTAAGLKTCNFPKKRLQHRCFPVKSAKNLRTPAAAASEFCCSSCIIILSVSNIKCISNQHIKVNAWSVVWCCIHSKIIPELVSESSKNMLAHALMSLLVFKHGFTQICFDIFDFFCLCFMSNKYYLILLNSRRHLSLKTQSFYWWEKYAMQLKY